MKLLLIISIRSWLPSRRAYAAERPGMGGRVLKGETASVPAGKLCTAGYDCGCRYAAASSLYLKAAKEGADYTAATDLSELFLESGASVDFLYLHDYRRPEFVEEVFRICADRTAQTSVFVIEGIRYTSRMRAVWSVSAARKGRHHFDLYDLVLFSLIKPG